MGFRAISLVPASPDQFVPGALVLPARGNGEAYRGALSVTIIYLVNIIQIILRPEDKRRWASY